MEKAVPVKLVLLGDTNVGKTALVDRLINDEFLNEKSSTLALDAQTLKVRLTHNLSANLELWDVAGKDKNSPMLKMTLRNAKALVMVLDLDNKERFKSVFEWVKKVREDAVDEDLKPLPRFLIFNKSDLIDATELQDLQDNGSFSTFTKKAGFKKYYITSCKTGDGVEQTFTRIVKLLYHETYLDNDIDALDNYEGQFSIDIGIRTTLRVLHSGLHILIVQLLRGRSRRGKGVHVDWGGKGYFVCY